MAFSLADVRRILGDGVRIAGGDGATFANVRTLDSAEAESLVWISPKRAATATDLLRATPASVVIAPAEVQIPDGIRAAVVLVASPKLAFSRIVEALFARRPAAGIHPTATIHPEAEIDPSAFVGPHCHVGRAKLGPGVVLDGHVHVYDGVTIGARTWIAANAVLGVDGFGYTQDEDGEWVHFPHVGGVVLGEDVRVGAQACVVRGTLGDTIVESGTKLDNFVTVGHNARVGKRTLVASHAIVGGSAVVGDDVWVSPHVTILNGIRVGKGAVLGAGAVVVADVPDGGKLVARPGRLLPRAMWRMRSPLA